MQIYAQLLDEGLYLCSVSTMYRVLGENTLVAERRRLARHPAKVCPELVATAPQQVYSWDITKLAGPVKGTYFDAYVMIDVYSRYIVGAHVHTHESGVLAKELMEQIFDAVIAAETNDTARGAADLVNGAPDAPSAEAAAPGRTQRNGKRGVSWTRILAYGVLPGLALLLAGAAGWLKWQDASVRTAEVTRVQSV